MEQTSNQDPKITPENVNDLVRDFGRESEADRKAALLSTLENQQALYVRNAMQRSSLNRDRTNGRGNS